MPPGQWDKLNSQNVDIQSAAQNKWHREEPMLSWCLREGEMCRKRSGDGILGTASVEEVGEDKREVTTEEKKALRVL